MAVKLILLVGTQASDICGMIFEYVHILAHCLDDVLEVRSKVEVGPTCTSSRTTHEDGRKDQKERLSWRHYREILLGFDELTFTVISLGLSS